MTTKNKNSKKSVLVSYRRHQGPMYSVLTRYGIGTPDKYGRGIWISEKDISVIGTKMKTDPTYYAGYVNGSNRHNSVCEQDFQDLFNPEKD